METISWLVNIIVAGADARRQRNAAPAMIAAYDHMKALLQDATPPVDLSPIEEQPISQRSRGYLAVDLELAGAAVNPEVLLAAADLLAALSANQAATMAARHIGVDLDQLRAASLTLTNIMGQDIAVRIQRSEFTSDVTISEAQAGSGGTGIYGAAPVINQLQDVKARDISFVSKTYIGSDTGALNLDDVERSYLRGLYADCNEVLLAGDAPPDAGQRRPRLAHIYIDLDTSALPSENLVQSRLYEARVNVDVLRDCVLRLSARFDQYIRGEDLQTHWRTAVRVATERTSDTYSHQVSTSWIQALAHLTRRLSPEEVQELQVNEETLRGAFAPFTALESIRDNNQLVILGNPGSGKSTLTRRLAGVLASTVRSDLDDEESRWLADVQTLFGRWLLPVRITLSHWANHLAPTAQGVADDLIEECMRVLSQTAKLPGAAQKAHFVARLTADPPTALLLLDGLDEVVDPQWRHRLLRAVQNFCQDFAAVPLVVTCRIRPYQAWQQSGEALSLPATTLAPLSDEAIDTFIKRWHAELL
jgi:hypothetical protein